MRDYDFEAKQEVHSRHTYLTDTQQATGYSCISHPFSWVISQLVTCRDRFSLIRILPYRVARLNRFHGCVVFLCSLSVRCQPVPVHTKAQRTVDYTLRTQKDYSSPIRDTAAEFLVFWIENEICLLVETVVSSVSLSIERFFFCDAVSVTEVTYVLSIETGGIIINDESEGCDMDRPGFEHISPECKSGSLPLCHCAGVLIM